MSGSWVVPAKNWSTGQKSRVRGGSSLERCWQSPRVVAVGWPSVDVKLGGRIPNSATRTVIRT